MRAKLRTVAASNNRGHPTRSLYYCLFAPHTYSVFLHAHPVRGKSYIERNGTGEVATIVNIYLMKKTSTIHSVDTELIYVALKLSFSKQYKV